MCRSVFDSWYCAADARLCVADAWYCVAEARYCEAAAWCCVAGAWYCVAGALHCVVGAWNCVAYAWYGVAGGWWCDAGARDSVTPYVTVELRYSVLWLPHIYVLCGGYMVLCGCRIVLCGCHTVMPEYHTVMSGFRRYCAAEVGCRVAASWHCVSTIVVFYLSNYSFYLIGALSRAQENFT